MIIIMFEENVTTTWDGLCTKINVAKTSGQLSKKIITHRDKFDRVWRSMFKSF